MFGRALRSPLDLLIACGAGGKARKLFFGTPCPRGVRIVRLGLLERLLQRLGALLRFLSRLLLRRLLLLFFLRRPRLLGLLLLEELDLRLRIFLCFFFCLFLDGNGYARGTVDLHA